MGAAIMLGTLGGLVVFIFGLVLRFDPEARRASHLVTKVPGLVDAGPTEQLFEGVPNQPK